MSSVSRRSNQVFLLFPEPSAGPPMTSPVVEDEDEDEVEVEEEDVPDLTSFTIDDMKQ